MQQKFRETRLEKEDAHLKLTDLAGTLLLELRGFQIDDAIRCGFVDPVDLHYSMFEFARLREEAALFTAAGSSDSVPAARGKDADKSFLAGMNIRWE